MQARTDGCRWRRPRTIRMPGCGCRGFRRAWAALRFDERHTMNKKRGASAVEGEGPPSEISQPMPRVGGLSQGGDRGLSRADSARRGRHCARYGCVESNADLREFWARICGEMFEEVADSVERAQRAGTAAAAPPGAPGAGRCSVRDAAADRAPALIGRRPPRPPSKRLVNTSSGCRKTLASSRVMTHRDENEAVPGY